MASLRSLITQGFVHQPFKNIERLLIISCSKKYSVFHKGMKKPIFKHEDQTELKEQDEFNKMSNQQIIPAYVFETSSEFYDPVVRKFVSYMTKEGKKDLANEVLRKCFAIIKRTQIERYNKAETPEEKAEIELNPMNILYKAVKNTSPVLELVKMRKGGIKYQVPHPVTDKRSRFLGMNWILEAAKNKERKVNVWETLATELIDASNNTGSVVKRKLELHKQCEANRAYAHFRWI